MQITRNTTAMLAGVSAQTDADARQWCVVVIKGSFRTSPGGELRLASEQRPLVETDEHYGAPEHTPVRYENDFALHKPLTDVLVVGKAVAPGRVPVQELLVRLEVAGQAKDVLVIGERCWVHVAGELRPSPAVPFVELPLRFDRAFGGIDTPRGPESVQVERNNPGGVGFSVAPRGSRLDGAPLPNLEDPRARISSAFDRPTPVGFGHVGRSSLPRLSHAGTFDEAWQRTRRPFLPADFDVRFFQSAPEDQQHPRLRGGELIRCFHMADAAVVQYIIPRVDLPMRAVYADRSVSLGPELDTIVLEPHEGLATLTWRARTPLPRKPSRLREIWIGPPAPGEPVDLRDGRPVFTRLGDAIPWLAKRKRQAHP
jgi:hypothetical protein